MKDKKYETKPIQVMKNDLDSIMEGVIERVAGTPDGLLLLQYLHMESGFSNLLIQSNEVGLPTADNLIEYNEGRRSLYYSIRKLTPLEVLKEIELTVPVVLLKEKKNV